MRQVNHLTIVERNEKIKMQKNMRYMPSPLQLEILDLISQGFKQKEIEYRFGYSTAVIKDCLRKVAWKLGTKNSCHSVRMAVELGYLPQQIEIVKIEE